LIQIVMCYTIEINLTREQIEKRFGSRFRNDQEFTRGKKVSAFSLPSVPVICSDSPDEVKTMIWGLIPSWIKDEKSAQSIRMKTFNAKSETLEDKPSFRNPFNSRRCMVLVNGFYEWQHIGKEKIPYFIRLKDDNPFALAGLFDSWLNRNTGKMLNTFTIITTPANPMMEIIHNTKKRMPAILSPSTEKEWIDLDSGRSKLAEFFKPFDENRMKAEKVG
jgi:putative SOS response-associated peptidase YedK